MFSGSFITANFAVLSDGTGSSCRWFNTFDNSTIFGPRRRSHTSTKSNWIFMTFELLPSDFVLFFSLNKRYQKKYK